MWRAVQEVESWSKRRERDLKQRSALSCGESFTSREVLHFLNTLLNSLSTTMAEFTWLCRNHNVRVRSWPLEMLTEQSITLTNQLFSFTNWPNSF